LSFDDGVLDLINLGCRHRVFSHFPPISARTRAREGQVSARGPKIPTPLAGQAG